MFTTPTSPPSRPRICLWAEAGEEWPYFAKASQGTAKVKLGVLRFPYRMEILRRNPAPLRHPSGLVRGQRWSQGLRLLIQPKYDHCGRNCQTILLWVLLKPVNDIDVAVEVMVETPLFVDPCLVSTRTVWCPQMGLQRGMTKIIEQQVNLLINYLLYDLRRRPVSMPKIISIASAHGNYCFFGRLPMLL